MKKVFLFVTITFFLYASLSFVEANLSFVSRTNLKLDESLSATQEEVSHRPQKFFVTHIEPSNRSLYGDTRDWIRLFHYYTSTRLETPEIPFNYIIDTSGNIFETSKNSTSYVEPGAVLVGYVSESEDVTHLAQKSFQNLIEDYSYRFGIEGDRLDVVEILFSEGSLPVYEKTSSDFKHSFLKKAKDFEYSEESNLRFSGSIEDLNYDESVEIGEELNVSFSLKNSDTFPWYVDEGYVFLTTADGEESGFAINQVWDSFSKPFALESQVVYPGEEVELSFELGTDGILPGEYEADFKFVMLPEIEVEGTEFSVNFEIIKGESKIVEIGRTNTGALSVYSCPEYTCEMVAGAVSGERYIVLEEQERWYKIIVDGVEGWVTVHYATEVD